MVASSSSQLTLPSASIATAALCFGLELSTSKAETNLTEFARADVEARYCPCHERREAAFIKLLSSAWQRWGVHFKSKVLAHAGKSGRRVVSAFVATAFAQETPRDNNCSVAQRHGSIRPKVLKLAIIMDDAEEDLPAYMTFPKEQQSTLDKTDRTL